jgi:O-6-methylguanine DNA methyltransferase
MNQRTNAKINNQKSVELDLPYQPPYDWQSIMRFYQSHSITGIERVTEDYFARLFRIEDTIGFVRVEAIAGADRLKARIAPDHSDLVAEVKGRVRKMFDLDCDPKLITQSFARAPLLAKLGARFPGLRLPRGWDPFETAICSILGQLVSAGQRSSLIGQLVRNYGEEVVDPFSEKKTRLFPDPKTLASADLNAIKTTIARREAIREFSRRVLSGAISLADTQEPAALRKTLLDTKGIGAWSAEYISLRAVGDTDAFPRTDLILKRALALHPDLDLNSVRPWRSYAAMYLWKAFAQTLSKRKKGATNMTLFYKEMKSPVGKLKLIASAQALVAVLWEQERPNRVQLDPAKLTPEHPVLVETERQLTEYFSNKRTDFDLPLEPNGSEFQKKVWRALREIPFGQTRSYLDLAKAIGSDSASRAVGLANGKNPLSIIVPCHRVVGSDGSLTGFAGGLQTKAALLALEAKAAALRAG